ncbi:MAG: hypothetical protein ACI4TK_06805, partial [Agathobacter sp.]
TIFNLHAIPLDKYCEFAVSQFSKNGNRIISRDVVEAIYKQFNGVTSYLQKVMNILYMKTSPGDACPYEMIDSALQYYLQLSSDTYEALLCQMPEKQRNVLFAIASERRAKAISSSAFVKKYNLPSASSVVSAIKGLVEKDFVTHEKNEYYVYDLFFQLWIEKYYLA